MNLKLRDDINKDELSMIEVAYEYLSQVGEITDFVKILAAVQKHLEISDEEIDRQMVRFYTDINIDGRFISLGDNRWGLRAWYAIDEIDEETIQSSDEEIAPRRRSRSYNVFSEADDMIDYNADDPEDEDYSEESEEDIDEYESDLSELGEEDVEEEVDIEEEDDDDYEEDY